MTVFFRVDVGANAGMGHLMRCLALAQELQDNGDTVGFICPELSYVRSLLDDEGISIHAITAGLCISDDVANTCCLAKSAGADIVVLDGYEFNELYQRAMRDHGPDLGLVSVDDTAQTHYATDIVVNQNLGAETLKYSRDPGTRLLLGPSYLMLRRVFLEARPRQVHDHARRVVVSMGGSDPANATAIACRALAALDRDDLAVRVIVGAANPHLETLEAEIASYVEGSEIVVAPDNVADHFRWADVAVSSGGSTSWELAYLGVPNVILTQADNQDQIAGVLDRQGLAVWCGRSGDIDISRFSVCLSELIENLGRRKRLSRDGQQIVDGYGVKRVAAELRKLAA